jgi:DNA-binding transcriptional regulator YiaG
MAMTKPQYFDAHGAFTPEGLAEARRAAGLSQAQLAALLGRSSITVSRWERGTSMIPGTLYPLLPTVLGLTWPPTVVDAEPGEER